MKNNLPVTFRKYITFYINYLKEKDKELDKLTELLQADDRIQGFKCDMALTDKFLDLLAELLQFTSIDELADLVFLGDYKNKLSSEEKIENIMNYLKDKKEF